MTKLFFDGATGARTTKNQPPRLRPIQLAGKLLQPPIFGVKIHPSFSGDERVNCGKVFSRKFLSMTSVVDRGASRPHHHHWLSTGRARAGSSFLNISRTFTSALKGREE